MRLEPIPYEHKKWLLFADTVGDDEQKREVEIGRFIEFVGTKEITFQPRDPSVVYHANTLRAVAKALDEMNGVRP